MTPAKVTPLQKTTIGRYQRPIADILANFEKPIPRSLIKTKRVGGKPIDYVPWPNYIKLLNFFCPGWSWDVRIVPCEGRTAIEGRLTIRATEGDFSMMATGNEHDDTDAYGDPVSNAEAMALRRACAKFGLGLHLWEK